MKKSIIVLLLLTLTVCSFASCGNVQNGEMTNDIPEHVTPSVEEMKEINHKVYVANTREELLKKHTSITYFFDNGNSRDYDLARLYYITADYQYAEGNNWAEIQKDRMIYELSGRLNPADAAMTYKFNLLADPKAELYQYVTATEEDWQDDDHDTLIDCYTQDGRIHLFTEMDEAGSERYAGIIGEAYKGQTYCQESIVDAETYELLLEYSFRKENGKQELVATHNMEYDTATPAACSVMMAAFEKYAENMMTVTFVADPGTEREIRASAKIPVNSECSFMIDDQENIALFTDRACTKLVSEHWDRMSDMTYYVKHVQ